MKSIIAHNIMHYRKKAGLTQIELAKLLNYSDKAISKWERSESVPDITVLKQLSEFFGITLDELTQEKNFDSDDKIEANKSGRISKLLKSHKLIIPFLSAGLVWFAAVVVFVFMQLFAPHIEFAYLSFIYAIPVSLIVLIVFSTIWGSKILSSIVVSLLVWSIPLSIFMTLQTDNRWLVFLISIPLQVLVVLWYIMRIRVEKAKNKINKI